MARWDLALDTVVHDLDDLYQLDTAEPDPAMRRHVPRVYADVGMDWQRWTTPEFAGRFNGLMIRGGPNVGRVFAACFPSPDVLDQWLALSGPGDLLITHHPIDIRNGHLDERWAEGFVPISAKHIDAMLDAELNLYACHAPMDTSMMVGTSAAIVEALGGTVESHFWPYGNGFAGHVCRVEPTSSEALVDAVRTIFDIDRVEIRGCRRDVLDRVAVVGGIGDSVEQMAAAERLGAQAYLTGEIHVRIEGERGRRTYADVEAFAQETTMTLIGVSHAASEHLVMRTQLARWFASTYGNDLTPLDEPQWWR